ncbi:hypothetical protein P3X46_010910 [Hevea brasiliensis]|uniref:Uncharacterized protein n=1 Tax=Hevea brasiliensis TaxID=3981 RepID=A0ABQ9MFL5_HEVBR|nr:uncharacterized protein LOC110643933 [Hevea brasiliensis]KAJ9179086.1 hypothetical protein P3X46_010910 [Hevea brasiliensis]
MASIITFNCSLAAPTRASSGSTRKPEPSLRRPASSTWWAPLFGWSSDPDYVNTTSSSGASSVDVSDKQSAISQFDSESDRPRPRFTLGCFTEDKARQLRKKTMENSSFHDIMYHSAIASRLASDTSGRTDK